MGCCCLKYDNLGEWTFNTGQDIEGTKKFLMTPDNWKKIIPNK